MKAREWYVALRAMDAFIAQHHEMGDYTPLERAEHATVRKIIQHEWAKADVHESRRVTA